MNYEEVISKLETIYFDDDYIRGYINTITNYVDELESKVYDLEIKIEELENTIEFIAEKYHERNPLL